MKKGLKRAIIVVSIILGLLIISAGALGYILLDRLSTPTNNKSQETDDGSIGAIGTPDPLVGANEDIGVNVDQTRLSQDDLSLIEQEKNSKDYVNILLLGVDRRGSGGSYARTDTMMIATLDKKNQRIKLTSIMRDLYVPIPGYGSTRLNSASVYGGLDLTMKTINEDFSLNITKYILVDFRMFEKVVNKLGGISLYLYDSEVSAANDNIAGLNKERGAVTQEDIWSGFIGHGSGVKNLNGKQALGYARIRHMGSGDFDRVTRQYKVLQAIYDKFFKKNLSEQYTILYDVLPLVETNMDKTEIIELAMSVLSLGQNKIFNYRLPVTGSYKSASIKGMSVLVPDLPANVIALHQFIYEATEQPPETADISTNGTYISPTLSPSASVALSPVPSVSPSPKPTTASTPTPTHTAGSGIQIPNITPTPSTHTP